MKKIFISYSHDNLKDQQELIKHLSVLKRNGLINEWSDQDILAGEKWDEVIRGKLFTSDIVIFLVSSEFLASDYINDVEIEETVKRYNSQEVKIFPIILNHCLWKETVLRGIQAVPTDEGKIKPISAWIDRNNAFYRVSIELLKSINSNSIKDEFVTEVYKYKKEILSNKNQSNEQKENNPSITIDVVFKLLLIIFLLLFGIGFFYTTLIMDGETFEKLPIIIVFSILLCLCFVAYFAWKYIEMKQVKTELSTAN